MTIDINKNSALIDPASSGYSGCGCGNRRYYTKAEIDEMFKDVLDPEQIEELINSIIEEYIESGELYDLIEQMFGEIYTKEEIDQILEDYATRNWARTFVGNEMAAETARTENTYLKDITITINGTPLHNNGEIIVEGGGGEPVDISGKLDTTAFTQAMENETARTENTYAKKSEIPSLEGYATENWVNNQGFLKNADISNKVDKSDFNSFTATTKQCCDFVKGEITDIWDAIAALTGDTPTPPTPAGECISLEITYNVTSTTLPTRIMNSLEVQSPYSRVFLPGGYEITKQTGYTFQELGEQKLIYVFEGEAAPRQSAGTSAGWYGIDSIVDVAVVYGCMGGHLHFYGANSFDYCSNLRSVRFVGSGMELAEVYGPRACQNLTNVVLPNNGSLSYLYGFMDTPYTDTVNTAITLPDGLDTIKDFLRHTLPISETIPCNVTAIVIPSSITQFNGTNFTNCPNLESITILATTPPALENIESSLGDTNEIFPIYVPAESVAEYKRNSYYQHYAYRIEAIPNE